MVWAHPVIWKGGVSISSQLTDSLQAIKAHYSPSSRRSIGVHSVRIEGCEYRMLQGNFLLKRRNGESSQANIYLLSGAGGRVLDGKEGILHVGLQGDWETQRIYTYLSGDTYIKKDTLYFIRSRVGVAPYEGAYEDLHTWLILQGDYKWKSEGEIFSVMPVIRVFKKNVLFEIGANFNGQYLGTVMVHF